MSSEETMHNKKVVDKNIAIELPELKKGEKTSVTYNGTLTNKGADKIYLHYGFDGWNNTDTVAMKKDRSGSYNTAVRVEGNHALEFCFKDSANNWDNNNGSNWKVDINS